jgi:hypothetical protein
MRLLALLALVGCSPDANLTPVAPSGAATASFEDAVQGVRADHFALGGASRSPLVDYLFVVDNSISMARLLPKVREGFKALAATPEAFGERARVGVMTTVPADPDFPGAVHPATQPVPGIELDPGFGHLVTGARIRDYVTAMPRGRRTFAQPGCKGGWFSPNATSPRGVSCLEAHTQVSLAVVGVEAGITAFSQILDSESFAFREGAAVNVIFVSDTHDPGIDISKPMGQKLVESRPLPEVLAERVLESYGASAFRFHAISPHSVCTGEDWTSIGPVYREAAAATGGADIDICTTDDYRAIFDHIATVGAQAQQPVLVLEREPSEVVEVLLDGHPVDYTLEGKRLRLPKLPERASEISVRYRFE